MVAHLLPFRWPDADPAALRAVASGWTTSAAGLQDAADRLTGPVGDLSSVRSPEIDAVVTRCTAAQLGVRDLARSHASIGRSCLTLAGHVDAAHTEIRAAFADVDTLASASLDVGVAAVTGEDIADTLRQLIEHLQDVLRRLQDLVESAVEVVQDALDRITALLDRLAELVTTAVTVGFTLATVAPAAVAGIGRACSPRVDLRAMEGPGEDEGHTIRDHVGKDDAYLKNRHKPEAPTFNDLATAEALTAANIAAHQHQITRWLAKAKTYGRLPLTAPAPANSGRVYVAATGEFVEPEWVTTVLIKTGRGTFIVLTSYLEP